jgi:outer membrane protein TolC
LPAISLTGAYGSQSNELDSLLAGDSVVWSIAGHIVQPIIQGGRLRANVALSDAREREAAEAYIGTVLTALSEVETALARDAFLARRTASLSRAAEAAEEARRIGINRYRAGLVPFITVLESQQRAIDARSAYITTRRARLDNRVDLHLALGGGFGTSSPQECSQ